MNIYCDLDNYEIVQIVTGPNREAVLKNILTGETEYWGSVENINHIRIIIDGEEFEFISSE